MKMVKLFFNLLVVQTKIMRPATLLKKRLWQMCFPLNFTQFLGIPFSIENLRWLLLNWTTIILPLLVDDKPDVVIIHVGTNDILNNANHKDIQSSHSHMFFKISVPKNSANFTGKHL